MVIKPKGFHPKPSDSEGDGPKGISVIREDCLTDVREALLVKKAENRHLFAIVALPLSEFIRLSLNLDPSNVEFVRGHMVVREITWEAWQTDKVRLEKIALELAIIAAKGIRHTPGQEDS